VELAAHSFPAPRSLRLEAEWLRRERFLFHCRIGAGSQNVYEGKFKPLNSFLSHGTLGSSQRDETASRGPASTWEGIPFGMSLQ